MIGSVEFANGYTCLEQRIDVSGLYSMSRKFEVKEKLVYKYNATLVAIMEKYKVDRGCNFKVKRLDSKGTSAVSFMLFFVVVVVVDTYSVKNKLDSYTYTSWFLVL